MSSFVRRASKSSSAPSSWRASSSPSSSFALADLKNFGTGSLGIGLDSTTLAKIGGQKITDREMRDAMQRRTSSPPAESRCRLPEPGARLRPAARAVNRPEGDHHLCQQIRLSGFKRWSTPKSRICRGSRTEQPASVQGYQTFLGQNRLTDREVRELLSAEIVGRYLLLPVSAETGSRSAATPYASMLLEARRRSGGGSVPPSPPG
jgi:hypothetical protein